MSMSTLRANSDEWGAAWEDEIRQSQEDADLVEEACECRTSSSDEEDAGPHDHSESYWWMPMLRKAAA